MGEGASGKEVGEREVYRGGSLREGGEPQGGI